MVTKTLATTTTKAANLFDNDDGGQLESSSMVVDNGGECQCINSYGQIPYSRVPVISCGDQSVWYVVLIEISVFCFFTKIDYSLYFLF